MGLARVLRLGLRKQSFLDFTGTLIARALARGNLIFSGHLLTCGYADYHGLYQAS
jgi:hypothetical protein